MVTAWIVLVAIALTIGAGLGAMLGSVNLSQGTTLAVVTGMGAVLSSGWLARRFLDWIEQQRPETWRAISIRTGFILGAINLTVGLVLAVITVWRVIWPTQSWPWMLLGSGLGLLGASLGGLIAVRAVSEANG
ncbi:hypothetical protein C1752_03398 [Acaryochloris thomasi RCC1774]|uniref:Uncharacterized protein n=1 Tax=Acaryochloris thomasi RCC1774 TaxID=1764569 RepID=A0A2W1JFU2_9CYAN|nr:hypothetical protein [Acaryochloris thomasi]PZD72563.1 hypothetical protein C1752_03398 [Acaryochloris thomasi RCC1774]